MNDTRVHSIDEYIIKFNDLLNDSFSVYRGQCCSSWSLEPGIIRKIKRTYTGIGQSGLLFRLSVDHVIELLKKARDNKHFSTNECDLNILAILQHYGAATPLLDFSHDPLVALYFACQPYEENAFEADGKIFCINYSSQIRSHSSPLRPVTDPSLINIESILDDASRYIWYWKSPNDLCGRSEKQRSVFIFGFGLYWKYDTKELVDGLKKLVISAENKKNILRELEERYDISDQTLFPDIYGFAQSNSQDKIIRHFSAEEFYAKGEEQWQDSSFEWAAEYYKMAYMKRPDWIDARCKCALALLGDGEQSKALNVIDESVKMLGEKWKFLAYKSIIKQIIGQNWKDDFKKAEELANDVNEGFEFKTFVKKYSTLPYD